MQEFFREQGGVFGKQAEDDAIEKTRDTEVFLLRDGDLAAIAGIAEFDGFTALERAGDRGDGVGEIFRDLGGGLSGLEIFGAIKQCSQQAEIAGFVDVVVGELVDLEDGAVEIGFNDKPVEVARDEQRRVLERFAIFQELLVRFVQVRVLPFILPPEAVFPPDISEPAFACSGCSVRGDGAHKLKILDHALLKTKPVIARRICFHGRLLPEHAAEVVEMLLIGGGFFAAIAVPLGFELGWSHAARVGDSRTCATERSKRRSRLVGEVFATILGRAAIARRC